MITKGSVEQQAIDYFTPPCMLCCGNNNVECSFSLLHCLLSSQTIKYQEYSLSYFGNARRRLRNWRIGRID